MPPAPHATLGRQNNEGSRAPRIMTPWYTTCKHMTAGEMSPDSDAASHGGVIIELGHPRSCAEPGRASKGTAIGAHADLV